VPSDSSSGSDLELRAGELDPALAAIVTASRHTAHGASGSASAAAALGEAIALTVRMVVGPSIERTSDNADGLREYEEPMRLTMHKVRPSRRAVCKLMQT